VPDRLVELRRLADEGRPGAGDALAAVEAYRSALARAEKGSLNEAGEVATAYRSMHDRLAALNLAHLAPPTSPTETDVAPGVPVPAATFPVELTPPAAPARPRLADLMADPQEVRWAERVGVPAAQAARLLTDGRLRFDPTEVDRLSTALRFDEDEVRDLVDLVEVLGMVPLDLPARSRAMGLAGLGPLFGVIQELAVSPDDVAAIGDVLVRAAAGSRDVEPDEGTWADRLRSELADAGVRTNSDLVWFMRLSRRLELAPADRTRLGELRELGVSLELLHELPDEHVRAALEGRRLAATGVATLAAAAGLGGPVALEAAAERLDVSPIDLAVALGGQLREAAGGVPPTGARDQLRLQGQQVADRLLDRFEPGGPTLSDWVRWSARLGFPVDQLRPLASAPVMSGLIWEALGDVPRGRVADALVPVFPATAASERLAAALARQRSAAVPRPGELAAWAARLGVPGPYLRRVLVRSDVDGSDVVALADHLGLSPDQAAALVRLTEVTGRVPGDALALAYRLGLPHFPYLLIWLAAYWETDPRRLMPLRPLFARIKELPPDKRPDPRQVEELVRTWAASHAQDEALPRSAPDDLDFDLSNILVTSADFADFPDISHFTPAFPEFGDLPPRQVPSADASSARSVQGDRPAGAPVADSDSDSTSGSESLPSIYRGSLPGNSSVRSPWGERRATAEQRGLLAALDHGNGSILIDSDDTAPDRRDVAALLWFASNGVGPDGVGLRVVSPLRQKRMAAITERYEALQRWQGVPGQAMTELWRDADFVAKDPDLGYLIGRVAVVAAAARAAVSAVTLETTASNRGEAVRAASRAVDALIDGVRWWTQHRAGRSIPPVDAETVASGDIPALMADLRHEAGRSPASRGDDFGPMVAKLRGLLDTLHGADSPRDTYQVLTGLLHTVVAQFARLVVAAAADKPASTTLAAYGLVAQTIGSVRNVAFALADWDRLAGGLTAVQVSGAAADVVTRAEAIRDTWDQDGDVLLTSWWSERIGVSREQVEWNYHDRPWLDHSAVLETAEELRLEPDLVYEHAIRHQHLSRRTPELIRQWNPHHASRTAYKLADELQVPVRLLEPLMNGQPPARTRELRRPLDKLSGIPQAFSGHSARRLAFLTDLGAGIPQTIDPDQLRVLGEQWLTEVLAIDPVDLEFLDRYWFDRLYSVVELLREHYEEREPSGGWSVHDIELLADDLGLSSLLVTGLSVRIGRVPRELVGQAGGRIALLVASRLQSDPRDLASIHDLVASVDSDGPRHLMVDALVAELRRAGRAPAPRPSLASRLLRLGVEAKRLPPSLGEVTRDAGMSVDELVETAELAGNVDLRTVSEFVRFAFGGDPGKAGPSRSPGTGGTATSRADLSPQVVAGQLRDWIGRLHDEFQVERHDMPTVLRTANQGRWTSATLTTLPADSADRVLRALSSFSIEEVVRELHDVSYDEADVAQMLDRLVPMVNGAVDARIDELLPLWLEAGETPPMHLELMLPATEPAQSPAASPGSSTGYRALRLWEYSRVEDLETAADELRRLWQAGHRSVPALLSASPEGGSRGEVWISELDPHPLLVGALIAVNSLPGGLAGYPDLLAYLGYEVSPYDVKRLDRRVSWVRPLRPEAFEPLPAGAARTMVMTAAVWHRRQSPQSDPVARLEPSTTWLLGDSEPGPGPAAAYRLGPQDVGIGAGSLLRSILDGARAQGVDLPAGVRDEATLIARAVQTVHGDPHRFVLRSIGTVLSADLDERTMVRLAEVLWPTEQIGPRRELLRSRIALAADHDDPRLNRLLALSPPPSGTGPEWIVRRATTRESTRTREVSRLLQDVIRDPRLWDSTLREEVTAVLAVALGVDLVVVEDDTARTYPGGGSTLYLHRVERDRFQPYLPASVAGGAVDLGAAQGIFGHYDPASDVVRLPVVLAGAGGQQQGGLTARLRSEELIGLWARRQTGPVGPLVLVMGGAAQQVGTGDTLAARFRDRLGQGVIASADDIVLDTDGRVSAVALRHLPDGTVDRDSPERSEFRYFPPDGGAPVPLGDDLVSGAASVGLRLVVDLPPTEDTPTVLAVRPAPAAEVEALGPRLFTDGEGVFHIGRHATPPDGWLPLGDASPYLALRWLRNDGSARVPDAAVEQRDLQTVASDAVGLRLGQRSVRDLPHQMASALTERPRGGVRMHRRLPAVFSGDEVVFVSRAGWAHAATVRPNGELLVYRPTHDDVSVERMSHARFVDESGPGWYLVRSRLRSDWAPVYPADRPAVPTDSGWSERPPDVLPTRVLEVEQEPWNEEVRGADTRGAEVRLNPLWMPLAEFTPEVWAGRPGHKWLYLVLERRAYTGGSEPESSAGRPDDLLVFVGSEAASEALSDSQFNDLLASIRQVDPDITPGLVRDMVDGPGHPSLGVRFTAASPGQGTAVVTSAGVAGELRRVPANGTWEMNDSSGRYMRGEQRSTDATQRWMRVVAQLVADQVGEPVLPRTVRLDGGMTASMSRQQIHSGLYFAHPDDTQDTVAAVRRMPAYAGFKSVYATLDPRTLEVVTRAGRFGPRNFNSQIDHVEVETHTKLLLVLFLPADADGSASEREAVVRFAGQLHDVRSSDIVTNYGVARILPDFDDVQLGILATDDRGAPVVAPDGFFVLLSSGMHTSELGPSASMSMEALGSYPDAYGGGETGQQYPVPFSAPGIELPPGADYDRGVLVVGDLARWRERPEAGAVVEAARVSARPIVVAEVGAVPAARAAEMATFAETMQRFVQWRLRPLVVTTAIVAELRVEATLHHVPVVFAETSGDGTRWHAVDSDGVVRWSTSVFTPALFVAAGESTSGPAVASRPADVGQVRLAEMREHLARWEGHLGWLQADDRSGRAGGSADRLQAESEIGRLTARITELSAITAHYPVEETERGLMSYIRVRRQPGGDRGFDEYRVLIDDYSGVRSIHPETGEVTASFWLSNGQWMPRLLGGSPDSTVVQDVRRTPPIPPPVPASRNGVEDELVVTRAQARLASWAVPDRLVELRRLADEG
ncbi:hypothetical protein, partial [Verrucosispora sp. SN26_14.1]|uniref:hypothetical protein n=1 Tax=Verrucosispora sp. SN26_14.1 TaxID=2527879 RepID=UPI00137603A8